MPITKLCQIEELPCTDVAELLPLSKEILTTACLLCFLTAFPLLDMAFPAAATLSPSWANSPVCWDRMSSSVGSCKKEEQTTQTPTRRAPEGHGRKRDK